MPWARGGDTSATYPPAMRVAGLQGADDRTVNEVFGFFFRLSTQSAAHMTDYIVDAGTVAMMGGANTTQLVKFCTRVGLLTKTKLDGLLAYKLVDDPEFMHLRTRAEVEWERQQRADTSDPRLAVPVRARDGDLCRYCAVAVQWRGRTSTRKGTLDHLVPGQPGTVDTMVVACKGCNSELRDEEGLERETLRPPPEQPFYSPHTADWLTKNGRPTAPTGQPRPGSQPDNASLRPGSQPDTAHTVVTATPVEQRNARTESPPPAFPVTTGMHSVGSGRDGSGNARGSTAAHPPTGTRSRRSPRGQRLRQEKPR